MIIILPKDAVGSAVFQVDLIGVLNQLTKNFFANVVSTDLGAVPGWEIKYCKFNCSVHVSGPSTWIHHNTFAGDYNHSGYNKGGAIIVRGPEGDNCIIENNTIYGWVDRAIWIMRGGSNPVIRFNTAYDIWGTSQTDHAGTGINIDGYGVAISGAKVYNNYVYNCTGLGLSLENAFGAEAYNNRFVNCGWGGFSIYWYPEHQGEPSNVNIHHNIVRNGAWGVLVNVASHWTIAHNVFIKDDTGGAISDKNALYVNSPSTYISNGTFANNIIAGTGYVHPVKLPDSKNIWTLFDYNIIVPVGTEIVNRGGTPLTLSQVQAMGYMAHGSTADPKFISTTSDWHLQSGSPAINAGTSLGYSKDAEGRTIDSKPKGAFYTVVKLPVDDCDRFARWLLEEFSFDNKTVMVAPASGFYSDPCSGKNEVRIAYVLKIDDLRNAIMVLAEALKVYPGRTA
jgi:hypothetical protein